MLPTLPHGKFVIARTFFRALKPQDIVIIHHGGIEKIKRIEKKSHNTLFIVGDNQLESTDSRSFGWISADAVTGKLIWPRH